MGRMSHRLNDDTLIEGWLRKKSHHLGVWKYRYFRFDGAVLRYWKTKRDAGTAPRGSIGVAGCQIVPYDECRLVIQGAGERFDEELLAKTSVERDEWAGLLAGGVLDCRRSDDSGRVGAEQLLRSKGLWQDLHAAAATVLSTSSPALGPSSPGAMANGELESGPGSPLRAPNLEDRAAEAVLAHSRCGRVSLRLSDRAFRPRQGWLVQRLRDLRQRAVPELAPTPAEDCREAWLLLLSARPVSTPGYGSVASVGRRLVPHLPQPEALPIDFEALHAYAGALDESVPALTLQLLHCHVGEERCEAGNFWEVRVEEESQAEPDPQGRRAWTLVVESQQEAQSWHKAISKAILAARAREAGLRRTVEEILQVFDVDPAAWRENMAACLADASDPFEGVDSVCSSVVSSPSMVGPTRSVSGLLPRPRARSESGGLVASFQSAPDEQLGRTRSVGRLKTPSWIGIGATARIAAMEEAEEASPPQAPGTDPAAARAALDRALAACDDVWQEAIDILDAALRKDPFRQDVCEAVLEAAIEPAIACMGRCWLRWNRHFSQADGRRLLRWLDSREKALHGLGVVFAPLSVIVDGVAIELSLRVGGHLRRVARRLLLSELEQQLPAARHPSFAGASGSGDGGLGIRCRGRSRSRGTATGPSPVSTASPEASPRSSSSLCMVVTETPTMAPAAATSNLAVDFFTMVFSCLSDDLEEDIASRLSSQRVAKFLVYEFVEVLLGWLLATHPEASSAAWDATPACDGGAAAVVEGAIAAAKRAASPRAGASSGGSSGAGAALGAAEVPNGSVLPHVADQWAAVAAGLANSMPMFVAQCRELGNLPLRAPRPAPGTPHSAEQDSECGAAGRRLPARHQGGALRPEALPREWDLAAERQRFEALQEALLWACSDVATAAWRHQVLSAPAVPARLPASSVAAGVGLLAGFLRTHLDGQLSRLRALLAPPLFERALPKIFYICLCTYLLRLSRSDWFQVSRTRGADAAGKALLSMAMKRRARANSRGPQAAEASATSATIEAAPGAPDTQLLQLAEEAKRLGTYFRSLAIAVSGVDGGSGPWQAEKVLDWLRVAWSHPTLPPSQWRAVESGQADVVLRLLSLFYMGPLPLREVLVAFTGSCLADPFEELPAPLAAWRGHDHCAVRGRGPHPSATPRAVTSLVEDDSFTPLRRVSAPAIPGFFQTTSRPPMGSFEGRRTSAPASASTERAVQPDEISSRRERNICRASDSGLSELHVEDSGVYGAFCNVVRVEEAEGEVKDEEAGEAPRRTDDEAAGAPSAPCRRWVQFSRSKPDEGACFEVLRSCRAGDKRSSPTLEAFPLVKLLEAHAVTTTELHLRFAPDDGLEGRLGGSAVRYHLAFDCPLQLLRMRRVLEAWTDDMAVPEVRPVTLLPGDSEAGAMCSWANLPPSLTRSVLEDRLGSLWQEVKPMLSSRMGR